MTDIIYPSFARLYEMYMTALMRSPVDITCRGRKMAYEKTNVQLVIPVSEGISIYSHPETRAFPISFALAELAWILSGSNDAQLIAKWNKAMLAYSDDGKTMSGAYGYRLGSQIDSCIAKLVEDKYSRQACATIWKPSDIKASSKDHPCNVFLQFMIRNDELNLTVISRSSDFITGLPVDAFHWQALLVMVTNELQDTYPMLEYGKVIYNIASLHVYDVDVEMLRSFENVSDYEHKITMLFSYTQLSVKSASRFRCCDTVTNLCELFGLDASDFTTVQTLYEIFRSRKHRFQRGGASA